jgi:hypothetical protein
MEQKATRHPHPHKQQYSSYKATAMTMQCPQVGNSTVEATLSMDHTEAKQAEKQGP